MTPEEFRALLLQRLDRRDAFQREVMRHESSAAANRQRAAGSQQGVVTFNTDQWAWALTSSHGELSADNQALQIFLVSCLQDGDLETFSAAREAGLVPGGWDWVVWADSFTDSAATLLNSIQGIKSSRQLAGVVCLATSRNPDAVSPRLLKRFADASLWSLVFHRLLANGLEGANASEVARCALEIFADDTELLFASDVDLLLARLIRAVQDPGLPALLKPLERALGEHSTVALAEFHLLHGRAQEAHRLCASMRFLSPALPRAATVGSLAALESGDYDSASRYTSLIEDPITVLKIKTRVAQASGDRTAELAALTELHELEPTDPEAFVQLVTLLDRMGRDSMVAHLCFEAQERFLDNPPVMTLIKSYTKG